ncbi:hypothetical protein BG011_003872 [Mortierella polycephala]|uniref:Uncharacterized protein n=1 Tax=Mortierella polycephala TaxID=41804 RepID=A0A9P6U2E9_9FUNG|nr:hypothetical protein BG011_003872 [Mortierella polycephala]
MSVSSPTAQFLAVNPWYTRRSVWSSINPEAKAAKNPSIATVEHTWQTFSALESKMGGLVQLSERSRKHADKAAEKVQTPEAAYQSTRPYELAQLHSEIQGEPVVTL